MNLIGTFVLDGSAFAVYSDDPEFTLEVLEEKLESSAGPVIFGPNVRLIQILDEDPPPASLPPDLSRSLRNLE